jgi:hypothetical protein
MTKITNPCRECGKDAGKAPAGRSKFFCSTPCRQAWNNRRRDRGAELYDLFMAMRYDRDAAKDADAWTKMCRMAQLFHEEDQRAGRRSYRKIAEVLQDRPDLAIITRMRVR